MKKTLKAPPAGALSPELAPERMAAQSASYGAARFSVAGPADFRRWMLDPVGMDFCVFSCGWYALARGMAWHRRDRAEGVLIYCVGGRGVYRQGGVTWQVERGDVLYCPPFTDHAYESDARHPWTIYWMHVSGAKLAEYEAILKVGGARTPVRRIGVQSRLVNQFKALLRLHRPPFDRARMLAVQGCALDILGLVATTPTSMSRHTEETVAIQRVVELLEESLDQPFDLEACARRAGYSRWHFSRLFKLVTAESPLAYFNRRRMEQARALLAEAGLAVGDVARSLGFADPYYFSRFFKQRAGVAPSRYGARRRTPVRGRRRP